MNKIPIYQTLSLSLSLAFYGSATLTHGHIICEKTYPSLALKCLLPQTMTMTPKRANKSEATLRFSVNITIQCNVGRY